MSAASSKNPHKAISLCRRDPQTGATSRSTATRERFRDTMHLLCILCGEGNNNGGVPTEENLFRRAAFMPGWLDGQIAGSEERGLKLSVGVFDLDVNLPTNIDERLRGLPYEAGWYDTRSSHPGERHLRLIVTISRPIVTRGELTSMKAALNVALGGDYIDVANTKNLNHMFDVPLAERPVTYHEGVPFDVDACAPGEAVDEPESGDEAEASPFFGTSLKLVQGGPTDALRHFEAIINKQIETLREMENGQRHTTCARVGAICGQAWQAAVDKGAMPMPEDEVCDVLRYVLDERGDNRRDTDHFDETLRAQFAWGTRHPFERFGEVIDTGEDELARHLRRLRPAPRPDALESNLRAIGVL